jgi:hypothetical protein
MHSSFCKVLATAATLIGAVPPSFGNVITEWDEKALTVVMPPGEPRGNQPLPGATYDGSGSRRYV